MAGADRGAKPPRVAIVVPTFNRRPNTAGYVDALAADAHTDKVIFICDSGSSDGTREAIQGRPGVVVHNVGSDAWWSGAVNAGVRDALSQDFEYVMVANDD